MSGPIKHADHPPILVAERDCIDCGTPVKFKRYWNKAMNGVGGYTTPKGWCGTCRRLLNVRADGSLRSNTELSTCPTCGERKSSGAKQCKDCAKPRLEPITATCQFRDCGKEFTYTHRAYTAEIDPEVGKRVPTLRKYCSRRCLDLENKQRRRDQYVANGGRSRKVAFKPEKALAIAFQHGYRCHICGDMIDLSLDRVRDPMGLTIDHVVSLRNGGDDDDENLRPAHRSCNSRKGHR